jgi:hypothetical protein
VDQPRDPWGPDLHLGEHRLVVGVPGSGKTCYARRVVRRAHRVIYFDPGGDYDQTPGAEVVTVHRWPSRSYFRQEYFRLVVEVDPESETGDQFVWVAQRAREVGNLVLLCDEVGDYNRGPAERALKNLNRNGHKRGIVTVYVSQRAMEIPLGARASATRVDSFLQDSEDDLDTLHDLYDPSEPGFSERVRAWTPHHPPVTWQRRQLYR